VPKLSASILSADLAHLGDQVRLVEPFAQVIHIDVMDGRFVPAMTFGAPVVAALRAVTALTLHGHLQVESPPTLFDDLAEAGLDIVSFHIEAAPDPEPVIAKARGAGMRVGLTVSPETPIEDAFPYLEDLDDVMIMSAFPGMAGQSFIPEVLPKVQKVRQELERRGLRADVELDGGISSANARRAVDAGANVLVAASAIFQASDVAAAARALAELTNAEPRTGEEVRDAGDDPRRG
jgi:ribulose-phosphate 3-epimerase